MSIVPALLLGLNVLLPGMDAPVPSPVDTARLCEMLYDRQHPAEQSQAALLLVENHSLEAEEIVRQGLRQTSAPETFAALAAALRLKRDARFVDELLAALGGGLPAIRQSAAFTLAELSNPQVLQHLQGLVEDARTEWVMRRAAITALGRSNSRSAVPVLLDLLDGQEERLRKAAAEALAELTGQAYGGDSRRWRAWWEEHKELSNERWLEARLAYQASHARRLEGELERAQAEIVRLHQQLYSRLSAGDRLSHVQTLAEAEDTRVRELAVSWCLELLPAADAVGQRALADLLLRFSHDGTLKVQRAAVLALGRIPDPRAFERLRLLLAQGQAPVRAAAARSLALHVRGSGQEMLVRQRQVVPILQKALDDPDLEVVVEAAESLGTLGLPEAGPVLAVLLRHPSRSVRQTAALAFERVADPATLDDLIEALDDREVTVRFSLVGALAHAAGDGRTLSEPQRLRLLARLEGLLARDPDPGVRSRAATVLGECGPAGILPTLWRRMAAGEDNRVQEKAWAAMIEILSRTANLELVQEWDRLLSEAKQGPRRLQLLSEVFARWQKKEDMKTAAAAVREALVQAQLEQGKWEAALPLIRDMLAAPGGPAEVEKRLRWLLRAGELALKEGNRPEALRAVREAQPWLGQQAVLSASFERLEKLAKQ
jgi:HEAT repeat protein